MAGKGFSVWVSIGGKLLPSLNASASAVEKRFKAMNQRIRLFAAETKLAMRGVDEAQSARRARLFEGAGAGFLGFQALRPFVGFEDALVRMGNTAQVYGPRLHAIGRQVQDTGAQFGFAGVDAIKGANDFVAAGMRLDQAVAALAPTLRLAKTAGVEVMEASQAGIALMQNLGLGANQLGLAFDVMARAGKEGRFEIDSMAKAFPSLASRAKLLGMTGMDGVRRMSAMLQVVRVNARDADEAENNLLNLFDKFTGSETLQHFSKLGVSIEGVWKRSLQTGTQFTDNMLGEIGRLTKGGTDAFALTKLFPDRQARQAALSLLQNKAELGRIYGATANPAGTLQGDFSRIAATSKFGVDRFWAGLNRIGVALGKAFGPALGAAAEKFANFAERFAGWAERNPAVIRTIGGLTAGLVAFRTATAGLGLLFGGRTAVLIGQAGKALGRLWRFALPSRVALSMLARLGIGALLAVTAPAAAGLLAIGAALAFVVAKWDGIKGFFAGLGKGFMDGLAPYLPQVRAMGDALSGAFRVILAPAAALWQFGIKPVVDWLGRLFGAPNVAAWTSAGHSLGSLVGGLVGRFASLVSKIGEAIGKMREFFAAAPKLNLGFAGIGPAGAAPAAAAGSFTAGLAGKRALGGPVRAGLPYLVGERGAEAFVPSTPGVIVPAGATSRALAGRGSSGSLSATFNIYDARDPSVVVRAVEAHLSRLAREQDALLSD